MEPKLYRMPPAQKQQAPATIKERFAGIQKIKFAFLFGSFLDSHEVSIPFHDIDIGIYLEEVGKIESIHFALDLPRFTVKKINIFQIVFLKVFRGLSLCKLPP
jgi:predicted nucleotidyltransferase